MNHDATTEILEIENNADKDFLALQIPHPARDISSWHILTTLEDFLRMRYVGANISQTDFAILTDRTKYSLRHCLNRVFDECDSDYQLSIPNKSVPKVYIRARELVMQGLEYARISKLFTGFHSGQSTITKIDNRLKTQNADYIDVRYGVLEILDHGQEMSLDLSMQLYYWMRDTNRPAFLDKISESTKIKNKFVSYEYGSLSFPLSEEISQREIIIPSQWSFPWGSAFETQALINSLLIRCLYHFLAINLTALRSGHSGGAEASLVLAIDKVQLRNDLSIYADIGMDKIETFVNYLTYGYQSTTPDPALQPLIPTLNGKLLIPCFHTITCDLQRNILSLMARLDSNSFNRQSDLFENEMIDSLKDHFPNELPFTLNKKLKINKIEQEFDVLLVDITSKSLLILELRWLLQPGDAREIANKMKECREKVNKINTKITFAEKHLKQVVSLVIPDINEENDDDWKVFGAVVIKGYGGILSSNPETPIITMDVLKVGFSEIKTIPNLVQWIRSLEWLPKPDVHFQNAIDEVVIGQDVIEYPGMILLEKGAEYRNHIKQSLIPFKSTN